MTKWFHRKITFFGTMFLPQKGPRAKMLTPRSKNLILGSTIRPPGMNKQKMRAEKPCRTQASELQTEPYSASDGQKPFWRAPVKILVYRMGGGANPGLKQGNVVFNKGHPVFKKGNPAAKKGHP